MFWLILAVVVWGIIHSVTASLGFKEFLRRTLGGGFMKLYRLLYNIFSALSFAPILYLMAVLPTQSIYQVPAPWSYLMLAGQGLSVILLFVAVLQTDTLSFVGLRQLFEEEKPGKLVKGGFYRIVRHPLYTFGLLILWLSPGVNIVFPFTRVVKLSAKTQEVKEVAEVPSKEGLILDLEVSLLFRLDPNKADQIYKGVGSDYAPIAVAPQFRSAIREVTASYEAKSLYSAERERIALEIFQLCDKLMKDRGIIVEQVLLRKIGLPAVVANAIQEKLRREQEAEQMKFVLQKEQQEAERKRIEAQGIADFQRIVAQGISSQLLEWKGIEATEKLAQSANTKIVVIGNPKSGLPIILSGEGR